MGSEVKITKLPPVEISAPPFSRKSSEWIYDRRQKGVAFSKPTKSYGIISLDWSKCAICSTTSKSVRLVRDHDHKTGLIRGILCDVCNSWLHFVEYNMLRKKNIIDWSIRYGGKIEFHLTHHTGIRYRRFQVKHR